jgi:hypothetical protein
VRGLRIDEKFQKKKGAKARQSASTGELITAAPEEEEKRCQAGKVASFLPRRDCGFDTSLFARALHWQMPATAADGIFEGPEQNGVEPWPRRHFPQGSTVQA